jgi:hypothetical protein
MDFAVNIFARKRGRERGQRSLGFCLLSERGNRGGLRQNKKKQRKRC